MPETPAGERDALDRITGAFRRLRDKRAASPFAPSSEDKKPEPPKPPAPAGPPRARP